MTADVLAAPGPLDPGQSPPAESAVLYARFATLVAARQVTRWLAGGPRGGTLLDLSGRPTTATAAAGTGARVLHVALPEPAVTDPGAPNRLAPWRDPFTGGAAVPVRADTQDLGWLAPGAFDTVVAEHEVISTCLATEETLRQLRRAMRPGGRLLLSADSLLFGLSRLAELARWAELADAPAAEVLLVPGDGDRITRCFGPEQLAECLASAGFDVEWIRPRTALSAQAVRTALTRTSMDALVDTELALEAEHEGHSVGHHLVAAAVARG